MNDPVSKKDSKSGVAGVLARLSWLDRLLVVLVGLMVIASFGLFTAVGQGQRVVIEQDGKTVFTGNLRENHKVAIPGPLGDTIVQVVEGGVRVLSSPCPAKICIRTGKIHRPGELLACVPNHLIVRVEGDEEKEESIDLISR